jgi:hypothetical protein
MHQLGSKIKKLLRKSFSLELNEGKIERRYLKQGCLL